MAESVYGDARDHSKNGYTLRDLLDLLGEVDVAKLTPDRVDDPLFGAWLAKKKELEERQASFPGLRELAELCIQQGGSFGYEWVRQWSVYQANARGCKNRVGIYATPVTELVETNVDLSSKSAQVNFYYAVLENASFIAEQGGWPVGWSSLEEQFGSKHSDEQRCFLLRKIRIDSCNAQASQLESCGKDIERHFVKISEVFGLAESQFRTIKIDGHERKYPSKLVKSIIFRIAAACRAEATKWQEYEERFAAGQESGNDIPPEELECQSIYSGADWAKVRLALGKERSLVLREAIAFERSNNQIANSPTKTPSQDKRSSGGTASIINGLTMPRGTESNESRSGRTNALRPFKDWEDRERFIQQCKWFSDGRSKTFGQMIRRREEDFWSNEGFAELSDRDKITKYFADLQSLVLYAIENTNQEYGCWFEPDRPGGMSLQDRWNLLREIRSNCNRHCWKFFDKAIEAFEQRRGTLARYQQEVYAECELIEIPGVDLGIASTVVDDLLQQVVEWHREDEKTLESLSVSVETDQDAALILQKLMDSDSRYPMRPSMKTKLVDGLLRQQDHFLGHCEQHIPADLKNAGDDLGAKNSNQDSPQRIDNRSDRQRRNDWLLEQRGLEKDAKYTLPELEDLLTLKCVENPEWTELVATSIPDALSEAYKRQFKKPWPYDGRGKGKKTRK